MESFVERREKAGVLLSYVGDSKDVKTAREALKIYKEWLNGKITYREALEKIKRLNEDKPRRHPT